MVKAKHFCLLLVLFGSMIGCATSGNYQNKVNGWYGKSVQALYRAWGTPNTVARLPNGNTLYVYKREQLYTSPMNSTSLVYPATATSFMQIDGKIRYMPSYEVAVQGQTVTRYCRTSFEANSKGIIIGAQFQGDNCIAGAFNGITP